MEEFYKLEKEDLISKLEKKKISLDSSLEGNPMIIGSALWITERCLKVVSNLTDEQYVEMMEK